MVKTWERRLFYYIRRLGASEQDAWDILQETWLQVTRSLRTLSDPACLPVWLYRVARNTAVSHLRIASTRDALTVPLDDQSASETHEPEWDISASAEDVHQALDQIGVVFREVLTLHYLESFSVPEIADILQIPEGTVKSRVFHAKRQMKARLTEREAQHG